MRPRIAWAGAGLAVAFGLASGALLVHDRAGLDTLLIETLPGLGGAVAAAVLGAMILARRPANRVAWLLWISGLAGSAGWVGQLVAIAGLLAGAGPGSWVRWGLGCQALGEGAGLLLIFAALIYPDGRLPGRRWAPVLWFGVVAVAGVVVGSLTDPEPARLTSRLPAMRTPIPLDPFRGVISGNGPGAVVWFLLGGFLVGVGAAVIVRLLRAQGVERSQLRWLAFVSALAALLFALGNVIGSFNNDLSTLVVTETFFGFYLLLPLTIGLAIARYGLYDIDFFVSRTIAYAALAAFVTAVYVAVAVGLGALVGSAGKPNLALSIVATALVAVGFQPVREWVQRLANRLVFGPRAEPYEVLAEFAGRAAESYDGGEVLDRMAEVLGQGTGADAAAVWLRSGDLLERAASWPRPAAPGRVALDAADGLTLVRHEGEVTGALEVTKRRGEALTPIEQKLVADLAGQAGLVLRNVSLTADLQARLEELRASRQRLVAAQDEERRRIERELHGGAQQHLVAIKLKLGLAEALAASDADRARAALSEVKADADLALETLRDLARGIYPPLLAEEGLAAALSAQARRARLPVEVEVDAGRYTPEVEATVYFCVLEALQNVQKHAGAERVLVTVTDRDVHLEFEVRDDGSGFDHPAVRRGAGLQNIADRLQALGGDLAVRTSPGGGTTVSGRLPALARSPAMAAPR